MEKDELEDIRYRLSPRLAKDEDSDSEEKNSSVYCTTCGNTILNTDMYCRKCGNKQNIQ